jgi:hypothetical protein
VAGFAPESMGYAVMPQIVATRGRTL